MSNDPLRGPKLKVERAKHHVNDAKREIVAFINSYPYGMGEEVDPQSGDKLVKVHLRRPIPNIIEGATADAVHNLRISLDQLACCLAALHGSPDSEDTYFPFARGRQHFESKSTQRKVQKLDPKAIAMICALEPYKGGNNLLWSLHSLDLMDKHRTLIQVGTVNRRMNIGRLTVSGPVEILAPRWNPLEESMAVFRIRPGAKLEGDVKFALEIAFREVGLEGQPVIAVLNEFLKLVEDILRKFESAFFK